MGLALISVYGCQDNVSAFNTLDQLLQNLTLKLESAHVAIVGDHC